jgi:hypothetical protein
MHRELVGEQRESFFREVLRAAQAHGATAMVMIEEIGHGTATEVATPEEDVVRLLLERADNHAGGCGSTAVVISDRPGGGRKDEDRFIESCMDTLRTGTRFVQFNNLEFVVTSPSRLVRLVQLADLVTSCTTAFVSGERQYAEPTFEGIRPMLRRDRGRINGVGLKIHPDYKFMNLYYWLLGDDYVIRHGVGHPLPAPGQRYAESPLTP